MAPTAAIGSRGVKRKAGPDTPARKRARTTYDSAKQTRKGSSVSRGRKKATRTPEDSGGSKRRQPASASCRTRQRKTDSTPKPSTAKRNNAASGSRAPISLHEDAGMRTRSGRTIQRPVPQTATATSSRNRHQDDEPEDDSAERLGKDEDFYPGTAIHRDAVARAIEIDPNHGKCLITGQTDNVRPFCVIPPDTSEPHIVTLQKAWGYDKNSLHAETKWNIIFLHETLYDAYEANDWMLLPEFSTTTTLETHYERHTGIPININGLYTFDVSSPRFTYHAVPTSSCKNPQLFETLAPVISHVLPHHILHKTAQTIKDKWTLRGSSAIVRLLEQKAGLEKSSIHATISRIRTLSSRLLSNLDLHQHRSAPHWLNSPKLLIDDQQFQIGRHEPGSESTCGWWSEINASASRVSDGHERPRPALEGVPPVDPDATKKWVGSGQTKKMRKSYGILRALEARHALGDVTLREYMMLPSPGWLNTVDWNLYSRSLPQLSTGGLDYNQFTSMDWSLYHAECNVWL